jgi:hypothetical protein
MERLTVDSKLTVQEAPFPPRLVGQNLVLGKQLLDQLPHLAQLHLGLHIQSAQLEAWGKFSDYKKKTISMK